MNVAVLSLTRDRLAYTRACFNSLETYAGCRYDHYILDQGSTDGTREWAIEYEFAATGRRKFVMTVPEDENIGIPRGLNKLIDLAFQTEGYDVIVKFDNDCQLTQQDTLRDVCSLVLEGGCILSPRILGLQQPPTPMRELAIGPEAILDVPQIGGIFMAVPAWVYDEFRYDETQMLFDDIQLCRWYRQQGGTCGYVKRLEAWHYLTTEGQRADDPQYFARKDAEYEAAVA